MIKSETYNFYVSQIEEDFVPYWSKFVDRENGGIFNCINNFGDKKLSDHKFTWSQGRYLWILGKIYDLSQKNILTKIDYNDIKFQMDKTYEFISKYAIYDNKCCYLLDAVGNKLIDEKTNRYDASIFADCFALIGMVQYVKSLHKVELVDEVRNLYESIVDRIESGKFLTEPYPIPPNYKVHSIPMILLNTTYEYIKMLQRMHLQHTKEINYGLKQIDTILVEFHRDGLIREHVSTDENYETRMLDRHINPGHTLECMWFVIEFLKEFGDIHKYLPSIINIAQKNFDLGWDKKHGGLFRFVDRDGIAPHGKMGDSDFEILIENTHDMKLWWPHSEMLYVFLLIYEVTQDKRMLENYEKAYEYTFKTFPNREIGEWIQIRKRDGSPEERLVALPVKDPFHILRNFIKIVELYEMR
ncbi:AGE family epimerase/isomerase [Natronincola ferrireducens]|uniref:N-acylglucosamine 2-epimerase n=1 Tax=Natronincola ferrireducens TaxID=393762 RepID=A0A1G8YUE4_9FIRM|nr:AGE family epimerase/isomerase [Natronincola ferrireducens]SDK05610.1 N-acylglucosamine 2-epimerase [Natronincola ferrireducens]